MASKKENHAVPWQDLGPSARAIYVLDNGVASDCCFLVGEGAVAKHFNCHKIFLITASPVFEAMFCGNFKEAHATAPIPLTDTNPEAFRIMLAFIYDPYRGEPPLNFKERNMVNVKSHCEQPCVIPTHNPKQFIEFLANESFELLKDLVHLAKMYSLKSLEAQCCTALSEKSKFANEQVLISTFELALLIDQKDLASVCARAFEQRFDLLTTNVLWDLDVAVLSAFIKNIEAPTEIVLQLIQIYIDIKRLNDATTVDNDASDFYYGVCPNCEHPYKLAKDAYTKIKTPMVAKKLEVPNEKRTEVSANNKDGKLQRDDLVTTSEENSMNDENNDLVNNSAAKDPVRNLQIIKALYESVTFKDMNITDFLTAAEQPPLSKYLDYRRKYEILKEICEDLHFE